MVECFARICISILGVLFRYLSFSVALQNSLFGGSSCGVLAGSVLDCLVKEIVNGDSQKYVSQCWFKIVQQAKILVRTELICVYVGVNVAL